MSLENIRGVIRKIDYTLTEDEIDDWCEACRYAIQTETYDFSSFSREVYSQSGKKRVIYSFPKLSVENMLSHYLKQQLDRAFHIKYASRSKIINLLFNTLVATKNMNDFVIVRADFKSFFDSVKSEYVYEKYILPSIIKREDKQLLEKYVENFKYCYAGLCLSNGMTEIVCKDFDIVLKANAMLPVMQSDIMLQRGDRVLIIDAKYYEHSMQVQFNKHTLHSANLYQIFTYVKNKEYELREMDHTVSGMLLYAKTDEEIYPNNVYQMSGNQITVRTLDLNLPFTEIAEQLDTIAKLHFSL